MEKLASRLKEALIANRSHNDMPLLSSGYTPHSFSDSHYFSLLSPSLSTVAFIDGGQAELISTPSVGLAQIKLACAIYHGTSKTSLEVSEFFVLVTGKGKGDSVNYHAEFFAITGDIPSVTSEFNSMDETLRQGIRRATPASVISAIRRFCELSFALRICSEKKADVIVLDGSLQESYTGESQTLSMLRLSSLQKHVRVFGISKTNSLLSTSGAPFASLVSHKDGAWLYTPIGSPSLELPHLALARLHENSVHTLLIESFSPIDSLSLSPLLTHASDPVFLGYPYGLIEADRAARVSNQDMAYHQTKLLEWLGGDTHIQRALSMKNAHSILDTMRF